MGKLQDTVLIDSNTMVVSGEGLRKERCLRNNNFLSFRFAENLFVYDWRTSDDFAVHVLNSNGCSSKNSKTHRYCIRSLAHKHHLNRLYSGGGDSFVCLWDLRNPTMGQPVDSVATGNFVVDVRVDCDNVFVSQQGNFVFILTVLVAFGFLLFVCLTWRVNFSWREIQGLYATIQ